MRTALRAIAVSALALTASTVSILPRAGFTAESGGKIRVGQIGTKHAHAAGKMDAYRRSNAYEVVGVVEPDPERRARVERSATYRGLRWMTEEQLLNVKGLQAVAIETEVRDLLAAAAPE